MYACTYEGHLCLTGLRLFRHLVSPLTLYVKVWGPKGIGHFTKVLRLGSKGVWTLHRSVMFYIISHDCMKEMYILCNDFFNYKLYSALYGQNRSRFGREGFVLEKLI